MCWFCGGAYGCVHSFWSLITPTCSGIICIPSPMVFMPIVSCWICFPAHSMAQSFSLDLLRGLFRHQLVGSYGVSRGDNIAVCDCVGGFWYRANFGVSRTSVLAFPPFLTFTFVRTFVGRFPPFPVSPLAHLSLFLPFLALRVFLEKESPSTFSGSCQWALRFCRWAPCCWCDWGMFGHPFRCCRLSWFAHLPAGGLS